MKVHRVTLLVVDTDDLGQQEVIDVLENARYPNHCMSPDVMAINTVDVAWTDDHPLNHRDTKEQAFDALFAEFDR